MPKLCHAYADMDGMTHNELRIMKVRNLAANAATQGERQAALLAIVRMTRVPAAYGLIINPASTLDVVA